jgi:hypothetical protein
LSELTLIHEAIPPINHGKNKNDDNYKLPKEAQSIICISVTVTDHETYAIYSRRDCQKKQRYTNFSGKNEAGDNGQDRKNYSHAAIEGLRK